MKVIAIITAAGSGVRFSKKSKEQKPKQFISLLGKPILLYSLSVFQKSQSIKEILITANRDYFDFIHNIANKYRISKLTTLIEGGKTRFESVRNAFMQIPDKDNNLILIHDAVRPNINVKLVNDMIEYSIRNGNTVISCKIHDTIKKERNHLINETIDRKNLWTVQTPQIFKYNDLKLSYRQNKLKNIHTDESSLVESAGFKVTLFEGYRENIKITTPEDLKLLKKILS